MAKRASLVEGMIAARDNSPQIGSTGDEVESVSTPPSRPKSRQDTKTIAGHFKREVSKQLHMLAVERDTSIQKLLAEALNDLFAKHGKPEIAQ